uniref:Nitrate reductase n=6 Tax=Manihot TaxID=3982 RepID=A0A2C9U2V4_MANES
MEIGGGKKVTRVEVTMDGGETWQVCTLDHPEKPNKYGKYWCWCFWSLEVEVLDLLGAKEIAVRAWDQALSTQPEKLIWNVMGMMNNCWFRVKTNVCKRHKGEIGIVFEHPTVPANQSGGWMAKERHLEILSENNQTLKKSVSTPFMNTSLNTFSMAEVKKHNSADSCWIIVHGHVYDCTHFLKDHPGGTDSILINAGTDCTEEFDAIHSDKAKKMLEDYRIGELVDSTAYTSDSNASSPNISVHGASDMSQTHLAPITEIAPIKEVVPAVRNVALVAREKIPCKLVKKESLSHDVRLFRFALPSEDQVLGLPVGKHIFLCANVDEKLCMRAYTPTSTIEAVGHFDLVIKVYFKGVHPKFPNGGLMSQYLDSLSLGSTIDVKGPLGHIEYIGTGNFMFHVRNVALVAREKIPCKLVKKESLSHDVRLFRFALPSEDQVLGLPVGKHIFLCANVDEKLCMRAYTPTSTIEAVGYFDLVIKVYFKDVKGPLGHIEYIGTGNFMVHGKPKFAKKLTMLAGGTGITPIYQGHSSRSEGPRGRHRDVCGVRQQHSTEDDILLRDELDAWAKKHIERLKVWYVVQESVNVGFITESILREHVPEGSYDTLALACGPPPMIQFAVQPNLEKMNYDIKNSLLVF